MAERDYTLNCGVCDDLAEDLILGIPQVLDWNLAQKLLKVNREEWTSQNVDINSQLSGAEQQLLWEAVNIPGAFEEPDSARQVQTEHEIPLNSNQVVAQRPYRTSTPKQNIIDEEVNKLLEKGIIEPCHSPYASPVHPVEKSDGTTRLTIDYRRLNAITEPRRYPLPLKEDILNDLHQAKIISRLDLKHAYYQVPMKKEDRPKTAFVVKNGQFQFTRMPFGLHGAPATFQRAMNEVFRGVPNVRTYLDDILVFNENTADHAASLRIAVSKLQEKGFYLPPRQMYPRISRT